MPTMTIDDLPRRVKLMKERARAEPDAAINYALYRAICHAPGCCWKWRSESAPERPELARVQADAHNRETGHPTETVWDILGQHDRSFPEPGAETQR